MVQQNEKQDDSNEVPSSNNTGIEMEQDFEADAMSLSEDSGEDDDIDGEDEELNSEMGPSRPNNEVVGKKVLMRMKMKLLMIQEKSIMRVESQNYASAWIPFPFPTTLF